MIYEQCMEIKIFKLSNLFLHEPEGIKLPKKTTFLKKQVVMARIFL